MEELGSPSLNLCVCIAGSGFQDCCLMSDRLVRPALTEQPELLSKQELLQRTCRQVGHWVLSQESAPNLSAPDLQISGAIFPRR